VGAGMPVGSRNDGELLAWHPCVPTADGPILSDGPIRSSSESTVASTGHLLMHSSTDMSGQHNHKLPTTVWDEEGSFVFADERRAPPQAAMEEILKPTTQGWADSSPVAPAGAPARPDPSISDSSQDAALPSEEAAKLLARVHLADATQLFTAAVDKTSLRHFNCVTETSFRAALDERGISAESASAIWEAIISAATWASPGNERPSVITLDHLRHCLHADAESDPRASAGVSHKRGAPQNFGAVVADATHHGLVHCQAPRTTSAQQHTPQARLKLLAVAARQQKPAARQGTALTVSAPSPASLLML